MPSAASRTRNPIDRRPEKGARRVDARGSARRRDILALRPKRKLHLLVRGRARPVGLQPTDWGRRLAWTWGGYRKYAVGGVYERFKNSGADGVAHGRVFVDRGIADRSRGPRGAVAATETRGLAAILAADVAGYSRLMGADEEGTLQRLRAHR